MKRLVLLALLLAFASAAPADAADPSITQSCTAGGVTAPCDGQWYTKDVTVSFILPGGASNPIGCGNQTVSTDTTGQTFSCSVTVAGSSQCCRLDVTIKRDATPPTVDALAAARTADANGWYNHAVGVSATGSDATSGIASCTSVTYSGPDSGSASVTGTCTDKAGNVSTSKALTFQYDATAPSVTAAPARAADANGWYNHAVAVSFQGTDAASGIDSCSSATYSGPDSSSASVGGSCRDKAGNTGSAAFALQFDATPPTAVAATATRPADRNGWYNHAVSVTWSGTDTGSGIASCTTLSYDKATAASGTCSDNAGNVSAAAPFTAKFDATPPKLAGVTTTSTGKAVVLAWTASADVATVKIDRSRGGAAPVTLYAGKRIVTFTDKKAQSGDRYTYTVSAADAAGNTIVAKTVGTPSTALLAPRESAHVRASGTTLRWRPAAHAAYYNVQLWSHGKKLLSTWPTKASLQLASLRPGLYLWLVWPGLGSPTAHRYGPLLGKSTFVVRG